MAKIKNRDGFVGHNPESNYSQRWDEIFGNKKEVEEEEKKEDAENVDIEQ